MSSTPASSPPRERVPPAVRNGILRADQLPPVQELPDEPDWDTADLFPPGRPGP